MCYSFLHDEKKFGTVIPQRGVRQGDPISPYIYIMCAEGLTELMHRYEADNLIHGCKIARRAPSVTHLLFADYYYFFFRALKTEACMIKDILLKYQRVSGQMINIAKSNICFSSNTKLTDRDEVCASLQVQETAIPGKYLGIPMRMGKNKMEAFGFLVDKVQHKLHGWMHKDISKQGKLTLLSSAMQVIPSFWMNLFFIPAGICEEIERKMNGFMWVKGPGGNE